MGRHELLSSVSGRALSSVMADEPPGFLFENCFRDRSITVFVAPPHRGKTLLMLDMAICLDMELPLFGRFAPLRGHEVFFLGCDAPSWDYGLQSRKLCIGHGIDPERRKLLEINGIWRRGFKITDPSNMRWLEQWRSETGTSVLFIDTHRATHRANENDSSEMEYVWDILCQMRDKGWCIIMSHHTSKPTEVTQEDVNTARGSSVIGASADFIYTLSKRTRRDARVEVQCVKGRGAAEEDDPFSFFNITTVENPYEEVVNGRPLYGIKLLSTNENEQNVILTALQAGPMTRTELSVVLRNKCPELTGPMSEARLYQFVDNRLRELQKLDKIVAIARGVWAIKPTEAKP
jgi:AAA domain-containing protein